MGLDISKITNAELKKLAYLKDGDNNGTLDAEEFVIFKQEAAELGVETEDFNQAVGLYTTKPVAATEPTIPTAGMTEKQAKKYKNEAKEIHMDYLKAYVNDGISRKEALEALDRKPNLDPEFKKAVADVIALMPNSFGSSDEIKHKELVKKLENAGIKDDLHEDILKQLEKMAKNECLNEMTSQIADAYTQKLVEAKSKNETKTSQQIMDEIKKEAKEADNFKGDFKDAYNNFSQPMIDAYNKVYAAIGEIDDLEKGGKVQDKAEEILKANGQWDKYTKKALLGDRNVFKRFKSFLTGYKGDGRIASDNQGRFNKVEHKKTQTTKEIMDSLGNKTELFVALCEAGFIKETGDGKWDLSELSEVIGKQVGTDAKLNRDAKKDTDTSEIRWTTAKLAAISELHSELSEKDAKALVKLCGYDIEGKHWGRAIFGGILGAASGAVLTGGSTLAAGQLPKSIEIPYYKDKSYDISGNLQEAIESGKLPEGITVDASGQIHIITDILITIPKLAGQLGKLALYSAVPGALVGAALGVASGLKDKGQMPKIPVNFDEMTYEEFAQTINQSKTEYAPVALLIAASFVDENGNWDREGYKQFLNTMAGDKNGIINREELIGGLQKRLKEVEVKNKEEDNNDDNNCEDEKCPVDVKEQKGEETTETTNNTYVHLRKDNPNVGWKEMVEAYFPGLVEACGGKLYGKDGAIKAFQRELCTDENGNFDAAKFNALIRATDVPKEIKIPLKVKNINRVIKKPTPANKQTTQLAGNGEYRPAMDKVGRDEISSIKKVGPSTYLATDGCTGHTASGDSPRTAVEALEKQEKKQYENRDEYIK